MYAGSVANLLKFKKFNSQPEGTAARVCVPPILCLEITRFPSDFPTTIEAADKRRPTKRRGRPTGSQAATLARALNTLVLSMRFGVRLDSQASLLPASLLCCCFLPSFRVGGLFSRSDLYLEGGLCQSRGEMKLLLLAASRAGPKVM